MSQNFRLDNIGLINRDKKISFKFNGKNYFGYEGDTLASALIANGVHLVGRSFKYHRPRGFVGSGASCRCNLLWLLECRGIGGLLCGAKPCLADRRYCPIQFAAWCLRFPKENQRHLVFSTGRGGAIKRRIEPCRTRRAFCSRSIRGVSWKALTEVVDGTGRSRPTAGPKGNCGPVGVRRNTRGGANQTGRDGKPLCLAVSASNGMVVDTSPGRTQPVSRPHRFRVV